MAIRAGPAKNRVVMTVQLAMAVITVGVIRVAVVRHPLLPTLARKRNATGIGRSPDRAVRSRGVVLSSRQDIVR